MIPGSDMTMEKLLEYHTKRQLRTSYEEVFKRPYVMDEMEKFGLSVNPSLSDLERHYSIINELRAEFAGKYEFAKDKIECTKNKILDYQHYYDEKLNHKISGIVQNDLPVTDDDIKWPPSYVSYHCKQEGFDAKLSSLHILILYQLGFAENIILRNLEPFLKELAKGIAIANFIDELKKRLPAKEITHTEIEDIKDLQRPINGKSELSNIQSDSITLRTVCKKENYDALIQQLHDHCFIDKNSLAWLEKGRGMKKSINALLTVLENRGYTIVGKIEPEDRCTLVKNTFEIIISKETTKRQPTQKYLDEFKFIKNIGKLL
jgi:hypothetical protein